MDLLRIFRKKPIERSTLATDPRFWVNLQKLGGVAGDVSMAYSMNPWVYASVKTLVENMTSVDFRLYTGKDDAKTEVFTGDWSRLFSNPNPEHTKLQMFSLSWTYLALEGECFWILEGQNGTLQPSETPRWIYPHSGRKFAPLLNDAGHLVGWEYGGGNTPVRYQLHEIVQFKLANPGNPRRGLSPLNVLAQSLRSDNKASILNEALLDNGAQPSGLLSSDEVLTDNQLKTLRRQWNDTHEGVANAGKTAIMHSGISYAQTGLTPEDMQYAQMREWSRQEVASAFGVPLFLIQVLDKARMETSKESIKLFWQTTVIPLLDLISDTIEGKLFIPRGAGKELASVRKSPNTIYGEFDITGVEALQSDNEDRRAVARLDWEMGVPFTMVNAKHNLGYDEIPGGDISYIPSSVAQANQEKEPVEPTREAIQDNPRITDDITKTPEWGVNRLRNRMTGWLRKARKGAMKASDSFTDEEFDEFLVNSREAWVMGLLQKTDEITLEIVEHHGGDPKYAHDIFIELNENKARFVDSLITELGNTDREGRKTIFNLASKRTLDIAKLEAKSIREAVEDIIKEQD